MVESTCSLSRVEGEAASRILKRDPAAEQLIAEAVQLPFGFAGFQAPACLTLAESISAMTQADAAHRAALGALANAGRLSLMDYLK